MNKKFVFVIPVNLIFSMALFSQYNTVKFEANIAPLTENVFTEVNNEINEDVIFHSPVLINSQTSEVLKKNSFEVLYEQRFGNLNSGAGELMGLKVPHNIRLGLAFGITNKSTLSIGFIKFRSLVDIGYKYVILKQKKTNNIPFSITYYGNVTTSFDNEEFETVSDRFSYFNQLIISRKFGKSFSLFTAPGFVHFNHVDTLICSRNTSFVLAFGGKLNFTNKTSLILEYGHGHLIAKCNNNKTKPGVSFGVESFYKYMSIQLFATTFREISEQDNYMYNNNDFLNGDILIGFNLALKINEHHHH